MNTKEKRNASILGTSLLLGVTLAGFGLYAQIGRMVALGAIIILSTIPLVGALNADSKRARQIAILFVFALMTLGLLGAFASVKFFGGAVLVAVVYMWTAGQFVSRN